MSYCALADIQTLNPKRSYSLDTTPTSTQVLGYCTQCSAEIDAILAAQGYTVPVTSPASFLTSLKYIAAYGAAALAEMGMFPETSEMGQTPHWKVLLDAYKGWLKQLRDGEVPMDLPQSSESVSAASYGALNQDTFPEAAFRKSSDDKEF
jgi:hypothetical protein